MKTFRKIKEQVTDSSYKNPLRLIFFITLTIFTVEVGIMERLSGFIDLNGFAGSLLDAAILISAVLPVLYFFFYRPFVRHVAELQASEQDLVRFATAIEQGKEAIMMTNMENIIEYVNPAFHWITGYPWEEVVGKKPDILKSGKHDDVFYQQMWHTLNKGEMWEGEIINRHKDGNTYYVSCRITPVRDLNGAIVNYVSVMEDITLKKLAEAEKMSYLRRLEDLSQYNMNLVEKAPIGAWARCLILNVTEGREKKDSMPHIPCNRKERGKWGKYRGKNTLQRSESDTARRSGRRRVGYCRNFASIAGITANTQSVFSRQSPSPPSRRAAPRRCTMRRLSGI